MWYAVETVFIDGHFWNSRCLFHDGDTNPTGHCYCNHDEEPGNSCKKVFDGRIEIHLDWFETEELAHDFCDGKITYKHIYNTYYKESIKSNLSQFSKREIIDVDVEKGVLPHRGIYETNKLDDRPY